jgi:uncharacterized alpha-E superfamily protein
MASTLLARYAESIFWLARYMERAENLARIMDVNETFARDSRGAQNWMSIVQLNADLELFEERHPDADPRSVIEFYAIDRDNPNSIISSVTAARENARALRPLISTEMWSQINVLYNWLRSLQAHDVSGPFLATFCQKVKEGCQLHTGITEGTFHRDQGYVFYVLGKLIERADQTTRVLDIKYHLLLPNLGDVGSPLDVSQWNAVLRSVAGYHAFRRYYPRGMTAANVAEFLLFNPGFPRSVSLCIRQAYEMLTRLRSQYGLMQGSAVLEMADDLNARMQAATIKEVIDHGLHEFVDGAQCDLSELTTLIGKSYFYVDYSEETA